MVLISIRPFVFGPLWSYSVHIVPPQFIRSFFVHSIHFVPFQSILIHFDLFLCTYIMSVEGSFYISFSKKEVGSGTSQNGLQSIILPLPVCAQTLSPSPREDVAKWAYPLFLPQKELLSSFYCKMNFSPVFAARLTFLLRSKTFCCVIKLPTMQ